MIHWPPRYYRTARDADVVARACPVESFRPRRSPARVVLAIAAIGVVAIAIVQAVRSSGG